MDRANLLHSFESELGLTQDQAERLGRHCFEDMLPLMEAFAHIGVTNETAILDILSRRLDMPVVKPEDYPEQPVLLDGVSMSFLRKHALLPAHVEPGKVSVIVGDPLDVQIMAILETYFQDMALSLKLGRQDDIRRAIDRLYGAAAMEAEAQSSESEARVDGQGLDDDWEHLKGLAQEAPIVRLVNVLVSRALDMRASDIHFEPFKTVFKVRCRVDGELIDLDQPAQKMQPAIISRLKLMAGLNIAERRLPQDGRFSIKFGNRQVDVRVSTAPTLHGESVVLRLLTQESDRYELEALGLSAEHRQTLDELITMPFGILLVTGPTGSGKTTTLYGVLRRLNDATSKIITVEDPVEYQIEGINQIQVKPQINLTFASALRSIVRQDPDILLIGEIRDSETANIAIESALTGHLVLSTLHTNDAPGAITRLRDLGMESFLIADSMIGVVAQRLVRRLCPECKTIGPAREADRLKMAQVLDDLPEELILPQAKGCEKCSLTGYRGRLAIFEFFKIGEEVRSGIVAGQDAGALARIARSKGYRPLLHDGFRKVLAHETTISEVLRATSFS